MTIYVDSITSYPSSTITPSARRFGIKWCHLWTDGNIEELHEFAKKIGLKKTWFQNKKRFPHYDIVPGKQKLALQNGAVYMDLKDWYLQKIKERKLNGS